MNIKQSFVGSIIAFLLASSCCWLPWLAVLLGGATGLVGFSEGLEQYSGLFMGLGLVFLVFAAYQFYKKKEKAAAGLQATISCPSCGKKKEENKGE